MPIFHRLKDSGLVPVLGVVAVLLVVLAGHASGIFGPPRPGTTVYRLLDTPSITLALVSAVTVGVIVLSSCSAALRPVYGGFFAGASACASVYSAFFFDSWLGVACAVMASSLLHAARSQALANASSTVKGR